MASGGQFYKDTLGFSLLGKDEEGRAAWRESTARVLEREASRRIRSIFNGFSIKRLNKNPRNEINY